MHATATAVKPVSVTMNEVPEPKFFQFEREGDEFSGVYLGSVNVMVGGKEGQRAQKVRKHRFLEWTWDTNDAGHTEGDIIECLGTYQIDAKIRPQMVGHLLTLRWAESRDVGQASKMKVFRVLVSEKRIQDGEALKGLEITDEDIPF